MDHLSYGDLLLLRGNEASEYLTSLGFTDSSCFVQEVENLEDQNCRLMVFQVLPRLNYVNARALRHQTEGARRLLLDASKQHTSDENAEYEKIVNIAQSVAAEDKANERVIKLRTAEPVRYGQEIQLRHVASQHFLHCNSKTALWDQSSSRCELTLAGSTGHYLTIEAKYKFRQPGDVVIYEDEVILRSSKWGLYMHIAEQALDTLVGTAPARSQGPDFAPHPSELTRTYEVNFAKQKTVWQAIHYAKCPFDPQFLHKGDVVRIQHMAGELEAEGFEVYVGERDHKEGISASGLFVLEESAGERRLRHLPSSRVLGVEEGKVVLSKHIHEGGAPLESTLRFFSSSGRKLHKLQNGGLVKIACEGKFLAAVNEEERPEAERRPQTSMFQPLSQAKIQRLPLIAASNERDDVYTITRVEDDEALEAECIRSSLNALHRYAEMMAKGQHPEDSDHSAIEEVLTQLIFFLIQPDSEDPRTCEGPARPRRQQLFRTLGAIDMVVKGLAGAFDGCYDLETLDKDDPVIKVGGLMYRLVTHASADSRASERYCAQWVPLFLSHLRRSNESTPLLVESTLTEIFSDNAPLLEEVVTPTVIELLVSLLRSRQRDAKYLKLLTALCTAQGKPVPRNQRVLGEALLGTQEVLMDLRQNNGLVEVHIREYDRWVPLRDLRTLSDTHDSGRLYHYFLAFGELSAALAAGRNKDVAELQERFPFDLCCGCTEDEQLDEEIRSKFVDGMLSLHVDQGELRPLLLPNPIRVLAALQPHDLFPMYTGALPPSLSHLKSLILLHLRTLRGTLSRTNDSANTLTLSILKVLHFLLSHGLYSSQTEVHSLLPPLCALLDGTTEIGSRTISKSQTMLFSDSLRERESIQRTRFGTGPGTELIVKCRLLVCEVLQTVLRIRTDMKVTLFLLNVKGGKRDRPQFEEPSKVKVVPEQTQSSLGSPQSTRPLETVDGKLWLEATLQDPTLDLQESATQDFLAVNLDLLQYENATLRCAAFSLLLASYTQSQRLLSALLCSQLLETDSSVRALHILRDKMPTLQQLVQLSDYWLGHKAGDKQASAEEFCTEEDLLKVHSQACEILYSLSKLETTNTLEGLFHMIKGAEDVFQEEPALLLEGVNPDTQQLLRISKAHEMVLKLALKPDACSTPERLLMVRRFAYVFLARFCVGNRQNQEELSIHAKRFVETLTTTVFSLQLVREIYRDNISLCRKVPIKLLRSLCKAISEIPLSPKKCECVRLLAYFLRAEGQLIPSNQSKVLGQLLSFEASTFNKLLSRPDSLSQQASEFASEASAGRLVSLPLPLQYLSDFLDIISQCCAGLNSKAESAAQSFLSVPTLKILLQAAGRCWPFKRAVLQVLVDAHFDTELSLNVSDGDMWSLLTVLAQDLEVVEKQTMDTQSLLDGPAPLKAMALRYVYEAAFPCLTLLLSRQRGDLPPEWSLSLLHQMLTQANRFLSACTGSTQRSITAAFIRSAAGLLQLSVSADTATKPQLAWVVRKVSPLTEVSNLMQRLAGMATVRQLVDSEFDQMARTCIQVDTFTAETLGKQFTIQPHQLFASIITLLGSEEEVSDSEIEQGLRLLRRCVEITVKRAGPAADWSYEDWKDQAAEVSERQQLLSDLGTVELLTDLYHRKTHLGVKVQCVLLGITLLLGGNQTVQQRLLKTLQQDKGNLVMGELKQDVLGLFDQVKSLHLHRLKQTGGDYEEEEDCFEEQTLLQEYKVDFEHHSFERRLMDLLRLLQLLCEGHFRPMQDHLRAQIIQGELHSQSFNFVQGISELLSKFLKFLSADSLPIGLQLLDTLVETVQGPCRENQRLLAQPKSIENCRDVLLALRDPSDRAMRGFSENSHAGISALKFKAVSLLLSLLEGELDPEITKHIAESLDFETCKARMAEVFQEFLREMGLEEGQDALKGRLKKDSFKGDVQEGFNLFCLLSKLADDFPPARPHLTHFSSPDHRSAFQFFSSHTARIEVVAEGLLQRVYFPVQPLCHYVSEESKYALMLNVNRTSPATKVTDLLQMATDLVTEMDHNYWLFSKRMRINSDGLRFLRLLELVLVLSINGLILFSYNYTAEIENEHPNWSRNPFRVLGVLVVVTAVLALVLWLLLKAKLVVLQRRRELGVASTGWLQSAKFVARDHTFIYFSIYLGVALFSQWFEFFFSLLLLDLVYLFSTLHSIARALTLNSKQILWTLALLAVWNYCYGFWGFHQKPAMFYDSTIGTFGESLCQSLWECVLTTWNNVRTSIGIETHWRNRRHTHQG